MQHYRRLLLLLLCIVFVSGCYAATIETGKTPSTRVVENNWAAGWIFGLVPPKIVETANQCSAGIARVQTMLSFPNRLLGLLTIGIYTPMTIKVTCARVQDTSQAESENVLTVTESASVEEFQNVFQAAAERSFKSKKDVFVVLK